MVEAFRRKGEVRILLLLLGVFVFSYCMRLVWISHQQLALAHRALEQGNLARALVYQERAIHPYVPFSPPRQQALREMEELCRTLEVKGQKQLALEGWRRMRGAILSTRGIFGQPDKDRLLEANRHIARLAGVTDKQGMMAQAEIEKEVAELLAKHPRDPNAFWGMTQFILLLGWIALVSLLIWFWADLDWRRRAVWAGGGALAWLGWLAALYLAG